MAKIKKTLSKEFFRRLLVFYPKSFIRKSFLSFSNDRFGINVVRWGWQGLVMMVATHEQTT